MCMYTYNNILYIHPFSQRVTIPKPLRGTGWKRRSRILIPSLSLLSHPRVFLEALLRPGKEYCGEGF